MVIAINEVVQKIEKKNVKYIIVMFCNSVINEFKLFRKNNKLSGQNQFKNE